MYSLVLMTAMSGAPADPGFNGYFRDLFNRGGCSGSCTGCTGSGSGSPYGCYGGGGYSGSSDYSSCSGCCGGEPRGFLSRVRRLFGGSGCCGGGYAAASRSSGCCGGGCCGGTAMAYSCFGGPVSYTPVMSGGLSCVGGPLLSAPPPVFDSVPSAPTIPYTVPDAIPTPAPPPAALDRTGFRPVSATAEGGRGTVVVRLPADARLYAEDRPHTLVGGERRFVTPELPAGREFVYRFRVEYERDGETIGVTRKVAVRAGSSASLEFADLTTARPQPAAPAAAPAPAVPTKAPLIAAATTGRSVPSVQPTAAEPRPLPATATPTPTPAPTPAADARATLTVKLPAGATLFVDDRRSPSADAVRTFSTPPLPPGKEFAYLMKAEIVRNGRPESLLQRVPFRAGERVTVDFTGMGRE